MNFGNALYLTGAAFGTVTLLKTIFRINNPRITSAVVVGVSLVAPFLISASVWADEQVIGDKVLGDLNFWSLVVVGIFLAGAETAVFLGLDAVKNIGNNQPKPIDPRFLPNFGTDPEALNKQAEDG